MKHLFFLLLVLGASTASAGAQIRIEGAPRACAGGIDDEAHTVSLRVSGGDSSPLRWELSGETGGAIVTGSDANGVRVQSGERPATPALSALQNGVEVGRVTLDFAPAEFYGRFTNARSNVRYGSVNEGIVVNSKSYFKTAYGKIYLKFRRSLAVGDVNGNWAPVANHRVRVRVTGAREFSVGGKTFVDPDELASFGRIYAPGENLGESAGADSPLQCEVTTRADGTAAFEIEYFKAANSAAPYDRERRLDFQLSAEDLTVAADPDYSAPGAPTAQVFVPPSERANGIRWFDVPADLKLRVLWDATASGNKTTSDWKWCDLAEGKRGLEHEFSLKTSDGTLGARLSPDGSRALILRGRSGQYLDDCHDTMIAELETGRVWGFADYQFGQSETWDFAGRRVAMVNGSLDTIFGEAVAPPLSLWARQTPLPAPGIAPPPVTIGALRASDLLPHQDTFFLTDNNLDRDSLAWTPKGDLLASSSRGGYRTPPDLLRFSANDKTKTRWQFYAWKPLAAPDGKHIAYQGYERAADGNWRDISPALCVSDDAGQTRRTLTRLPGRTQSFAWSLDGRSLFNYEAGAIARYDVETGARQEIARLALADRYEKSEILGVARGGSHLILHGYRWQKGADGEEPSIWADVLFALRLSDGQLLPIAAFNSDFTVAMR